MEFGAGMAGYAGVCVYNSRADRDDVITVDAATSDTEVEAAGTIKGACM